MRRRLLASVAVLVAVLLLVARPDRVRQEAGPDPGLPVDGRRPQGARRRPAGAIRGINGAGLPWVVDSAKGELSADGVLEVKVKGLVIDPNDPRGDRRAASRASTQRDVPRGRELPGRRRHDPERLHRPIPGDDRAGRR